MYGFPEQTYGKLQSAITLILRCESKFPKVKSLVSTHSACPCEYYALWCSQSPRELFFYIFFYLVYKYLVYNYLVYNFYLVYNKIISAFYGVWNLDFIRYILPAFCASKNIQLTHIILLNYTSQLFTQWFRIWFYYCGSVLNYMIVTSGSLFGCGDHFTGALSNYKEHETQGETWLKFPQAIGNKLLFIDIFASFFLSFSRMAYH